MVIVILLDKNRTIFNRNDYIFTGTTNADVFNAWIEMQLLPQLRAGQVIVMDNYCIHIALNIRGCSRLADMLGYKYGYNPL